MDLGIEEGTAAGVNTKDMMRASSGQRIIMISSWLILPSVDRASAFSLLNDFFFSHTFVAASVAADLGTLHIEKEPNIHVQTV